MSAHRSAAARLVAAIAGVSALLAPAVASPAAAGSPVSCHYTFAAWAGGFTADVRITNNGPDINGWTVRWTYGVPTAVMAGWQANLTIQEGRVAVATNTVFNAVIRNGQTSSFGWSATAASTTAPTDLTVNGTAC